MKLKFFSRWFVSTAFASALALGVVAKESKETKETAPPGKKPILNVDNSPVNDGKSGLVTSYADVVEPAQKTVVSIYSSKTVHQRGSNNPILRQFGLDGGGDDKVSGLGSGVIVSADGYILTNNHVVEGADELKVQLSDDRELTAKLIGADPKTDIAVVKIDAKDLPVVTLANSDKLRVGDVVFAVGNPLGVGQTITMGIVSAKGRNQVGILDSVRGYENFIQTDAAINMGNSGGALIDAKGRLVGINSAILSPSRGNIGIGFAIPVNLAASIMNSLIQTGTVTRGYLGVQTVTVTADVAEQFDLPKDTKGAVVTLVETDSPAEKAGLKRNDVVLSVDDKNVSTLEELRLTISQFPPTTQVKIKIMRDGKERTLAATLGKFDDKPDELIEGVNVKALTEENRRRLGLDPRISGLVITEVAEDSPFADRLSPGMIVVEINREQVTTLSNAKALLKPGRNLAFVYTSRGLVYVTLKLPQP